ncbi:MAG TPA: tRNA (adenosine(37)-N6)-threonylcarbamoyltransferase complex ATPase subunit type 1 TsaE [Nitrososphaera sp.]|nr:tRNA (adenosine(37)-N6)-threonylcarbamoyltransferase complex ATPase subunit type 1 TsaE [Nitrososphaera sp.]
MTHVPLNELPEFARNVRAVLKLLPPKEGATIVALRGNLGSGKTTFTQALARELEVGEVVQSPTYVIMKTYELPQNRTQFGTPRRFKKLVHIDAYRLESPSEFAALRPETFLNEQGTLVLIEWPEKVDGVLPAPDVVLNFSSEGAQDNERFIKMEK